MGIDLKYFEGMKCRKRAFTRERQRVVGGYGIAFGDLAFVGHSHGHPGFGLPCEAQGIAGWGGCHHGQKGMSIDNSSAAFAPRLSMTS